MPIMARPPCLLLTMLSDQRRALHEIDARRSRRRSPDGVRRADEGGVVRCGDALYEQPSRVVRRLCGGCSQPERDGLGCGDVLEVRQDRSPNDDEA